MQLRSLLLGSVLAIAVSACTVDLTVNDNQLLGSGLSEEDKILAVMADQETAWNTGDIDGFMQGYWESADLRFASGGSVTKGWEETRTRYHSNYSDRAKMGNLSFDELYVQMLGSDAAVVHGAWALQRDTDQPSGLFTLVFKQIDGSWKIVSDTTTSAD
ncbi:MAG: DUF4440 domain-containing protein [Henriciella sp.]